MPPEFVALDIVTRRQVVTEVAAVVCGPEGEGELRFLVGGSADGALTVTTLDEIATALVEAAGEVPWLSFDATDALDAWAAADHTGALTVVPQVDVGELICLAHPIATARTLPEFLALLGADAGPAPPPGLPAARAVIELWRRLPAAISRLPYALRSAQAGLLDREHHPATALWKTCVGSPAEGEPELAETLLRQRLRELTPPAEEPVEPGETRPIDPQAVAALLATGGAVAARMGAYEQRPGQVQMAVAVTEALNRGQCLMVEAGTGTGKSLAYLAPAVLFALHNQVPVVISTNTKNLQDQLCSKDLPLLAGALETPFRAELIKGRSNYLCVDKLITEAAEGFLLPFEDQLRLLAYLLAWAVETPHGDLDELSPYLSWRYPRLASYARTLASESEACTAGSAREHPCFATVARRRAQAADVLVINHALTLANAVTEVLPPYAHLVLDEAHNLEDIATDAFGLALDRRELSRLVREAGPSRDQRALANRIRRTLESNATGAAEDTLGHVTAAEGAAAAVGAAADELGERWAGVVLQRLGRTVDELTRPEKVRLFANVYEGALGESLRAAMLNLRDRLETVVKSLTGVATGLLQVSQVSDTSSTDLAAARNMSQSRLGEWSEQLRTLEVLLELADAAYVYWLEFVLRRDQWEWRVRAAPIDAGAALAERLLSQKAAVVMTSATLAVDGRFDYFAQRLGCRADGVAERFRTLQVPSSFDYDRQVLLALPDNIALPRDADFQRHVTRALSDVVRILDGRTLVLFTAMRMMEDVFEQLAPRFEAMGVEALCQGVSGARHALAERFRHNEHSVLFGTRSFWEGIDVPGDALRCVVIVKLPFAVPDDPVHEARCERLEAEGRNAWSSYSVPQAVILFKQGFGRLIRTATDRGAVVVLDRRLREKGYGRAFLRSVPGFRGVFDSWGVVKEHLARWFAEGDGGELR